MKKRTMYEGLVYSVGDIFRINATSASSGHVSDVVGAEVMLSLIKDNESELGLTLTDPNKTIAGFHNLEGHARTGSSRWFSREDLHTLIPLLQNSNNYCIKSDFIYKNKNLRGKVCKILLRINSSSSDTFVEFKEDINGGSCDGLGKGGHCIRLNTNHLISYEKYQAMERKQQEEEEEYMEENINKQVPTWFNKIYEA